VLGETRRDFFTPDLEIHGRKMKLVLGGYPQRCDFEHVVEAVRNDAAGTVAPRSKLKAVEARRRRNVMIAEVLSIRLSVDLGYALCASD
jgi:hypothetical protein